MDIKDSLKEAARSQAKVVKKAAAAQAVIMKDKAAAQARLVAADLWRAVKTDRTCQLMLIILILSIACSDVPIVRELLYPFRMFKTMIHECGHALMTRLTGGHVSAIALNPTPDAYGVTYGGGGLDWLVLPGGYMGQALIGGLLIYWGRSPREARLVLQSIGTALLAVTLFYGTGTLPNFLMMLFISSAIFIIARKCSERVCHFFLIFLAVQTCLAATSNVIEMLLASALIGGVGDAKNMVEVTGVPAIVWSVLWGLISIAIFLFAFWFSYRTPRETEMSSTAGAEPSKAPAPDDLKADSSGQGASDTSHDV